MTSQGFAKGITFGDSLCNRTEFPPPPYPRFRPNCSAVMNFTTQQLDMRRKAEILKYKGAISGRSTTNVADITTKKQRYVNAVRGRYIKSVSFASQNQTNTNSNTNALQNNGVSLLYSGVANTNENNVGCPEPLSASDVPYAAGEPTELFEDKTVPITGLYIHRSYAGSVFDASVSDSETE